MTLVERGTPHVKALRVTAVHLAEHLRTVMERQMPYLVCDTDQNPVAPTRAQEIITRD